MIDRLEERLSDEIYLFLMLYLSVQATKCLGQSYYGLSILKTTLLRLGRWLLYIMLQGYTSLVKNGSQCENGRCSILRFRYFDYNVCIQASSKRLLVDIT